MSHLFKGGTVLATIMSGGGYYMYVDRQKKIDHPVMRRGFLELQKDHRVRDYCGDDLKVGYRINVN